MNGGSIRIAAVRDSSVLQEIDVMKWPRARQQNAEAFAGRTVRWKRVMTDILYGPRMSSASIWCYGASTKGGVLLQYLRADDLLLAVADRNPKKKGKLMAGTWLPVTDEAEMRRARPNVLLVLPWAFREEFVEREKELRDAGTVMMFPLPNPEFVL